LTPLLQLLLLTLLLLQLQNNSLRLCRIEEKRGLWPSFFMG